MTDRELLELAAKTAGIEIETDATILVRRMASRRIGQRVRVAEACDRYRGTIGVVCALVPAFGTVLYRVQADKVKEYGETRNVDKWECLFFPDQLRAVEQVPGGITGEDK